VSWSEHHTTRPIALYRIVHSYIPLHSAHIIVGSDKLLRKPFGLVIKLIFLETNISLKGLEESSSSVVPIVHSPWPLCVLLIPVWSRFWMWDGQVVFAGRVQLKCDGTQWRTGEEVKEKLANGVGSQYSSQYLGTWCIQHYYRWCAHLGCQ
jgi:hypothetical protein